MNQVASPSKAGVAPNRIQSRAVPMVPIDIVNAVAKPVDIRREGNGRTEVRAILQSITRSQIWLAPPALPATKPGTEQQNQKKWLECDQVTSRNDRRRDGGDEDHHHDSRLRKLDQILQSGGDTGRVGLVDSGAHRRCDLTAGFIDAGDRAGTPWKRFRSWRIGD